MKTCREPSCDRQLHHGNTNDRCHVHQRAWARRVPEMLQDGYGVEDIAILLDVNLIEIQREVRVLRQNGDLERLFAQGLG